MSQSTALRVSAVTPSGMWMLSSVSGGPASIRRTLTLSSSVSLAASTQPADPAPTTMDAYIEVDPMRLHKEWATFIPPRDASTWQLDLTFLSSAWKCIFGCGCKGIHGEAFAGCCSSGVFIQAEADDEEGAEDFKMVKERVKQLTDEDWDLRPQYKKK